MKNVQIQTQQHKHQIRKDFKQKKKSKVLCAIKHKSGIKGLFASIIIKLT
jgi:hypothetical protein